MRVQQENPAVARPAGFSSYSGPDRERIIATAAKPIQRFPRACMFNIEQLGETPAVFFVQTPTAIGDAVGYGREPFDAIC